jgi:hypothetical protein
VSSHRSSAVAVLVCALVAASAQGLAQAPTRVRGTINTFDGSTLSVLDAAGKYVAVRLGDKTEIVATQRIPLDQIRPGDFLGVTSAKRPDGSLTALDVRRFPKPLNPGHRPFDGRDDQTMTNASVAAIVQSTSGRELTMSYDGGAQKIVVPENAPVSAIVPGNASQLVPGAAVNLTMDASSTALRIQVSPP